MMPPIENELAESDFDDAVTACLYIFEHKRDVRGRENQARQTAYELARTLAPLWGGKVKEPSGSGSGVPCKHKNYKRDGVDLVCLDCGERGN